MIMKGGMIGLKELRCTCGKLLCKHDGQVEIKCPRCKKINTVTEESVSNDKIDSSTIRYRAIWKFTDDIWYKRCHVSEKTFPVSYDKRVGNEILLGQNSSMTLEGYEYIKDFIEVVSVWKITE